MRGVVVLTVVGLLGVGVSGAQAPCACDAVALRGHRDATCNCMIAGSDATFTDSVLSMLGLSVHTEDVGTVTRAKATLMQQPGDGVPSCSCTSEKLIGYSTECTCSATAVSCPEGTAGHPGCLPIDGYTGTVKWNEDTSDYDVNLQKPDCPDNAGTAPNCACEQGYSGSVAWDASKGEWSGSCFLPKCSDFVRYAQTSEDATSCSCPDLTVESKAFAYNFNMARWEGECTVVGCPDEALRASIPSMTSGPYDSDEYIPPCMCRPHHTGKPVFDGSTGSYELTAESICTIATCPDNSSRVGDMCVCDTGYTDDASELAFIQSMGIYSGACKPAACPTNAEGAPSCACKQGYSGVLLWDGTSYGSSACTAVAAPNNGYVETLTSGVATGRCSVGYALTGTMWSANIQDWTYTCEKVNCPLVGSVGGNWPSCACDVDGYAGDLAWNATTGMWDGECNATACPPKSSAGAAPAADGGLICECDAQYTGAVTWANTGDVWINMCTLFKACPDNVDCHNLKCSKGYAGSVSWSAVDQDWVQDCAKEACPTYGIHHPDCVCAAGYSGNLTFNEYTHEYTGGCSRVAFPENVNITGPSSGKCNKGYTGHIAWSAEMANYTGSCAIVPCVTNASGHPACSCNEGFTKSTGFHWSVSTQKWSGTCEYEACPSHASGWPACACDNGYTGSITFDTSSGYTGTCKPVACPDNSGPVGSCKCNKGFKTTGVREFSNGIWTHECAKEECVADADAASHPNCVCTSTTAMSATLWNSVNEEWSQCETQACSDVDANAVETPTDTSAAPFALVSSVVKPHCMCKDGYMGSLAFSSGLWSGSCIAAACPSTADCSGSSPVCKDGFTGTVTWQLDVDSYTSGYWDAQCEIVSCPANSKGWPTCQCDMGYAGDVSFSSGVYSVSTASQGCEVVACPSLYASKTSTGACKCNAGYGGSMTWETTLPDTYDGDCAQITCPTNSNPWPDCTCPHGTKNSTDMVYVPSTYTWAGSCETSSCVANGKFADGTCACKDGYVGTVSWSQETQSFSGKCTKAECPQYGSGEDCACLPGYTGGPVIWDGVEWKHKCEPGTCPDGTTMLEVTTETQGSQYTTVTCVCDYPTSGSVSWVNGEFVASCEAQSCPAGSALSEDAAAKTCLCDEGYSGSGAVWDESLGKYIGETPACVAVSLPAGIVEGESGPECPGKGSVWWDAASQDWDYQCDDLCTAHAYKSGSNCVCAIGYYGDLVSDQNASCSKVQCPVNAVAHPICSCGQGYTGTITWDGAQYVGACSKVECPDNTVNHPACVPQVGYTYESGAITWNGVEFSGKGVLIDVKPGAERVAPSVLQTCSKGYVSNGFMLNGIDYDGTCDQSNCPDYASGFPDCACDEGYTGTLEWSFTGYDWVGQCAPAPCPTNAADTATQLCACNMGYAGTPSWGGASWTHTCSLEIASVPTGASLINTLPPAVCDAGYVSTSGIAWDDVNDIYTGTCEAVICPANANMDGAEYDECTCDSGFWGTLVFDAATSTYSGSCIGDSTVMYPITCPANAYLDASTNMCVCHIGTTGSLFTTFYSATNADGVTYNVAQVQGSCTPVPCATGLTHSGYNSGVTPTCRCADGYDGSVSFDSSTKSYPATTCQVASCPSNMKLIGNLQCGCADGYYASASGTEANDYTVSWDTATSSYKVGTDDPVCTKAACPTGADCVDLTKCQAAFMKSGDTAQSTTWDYSAGAWSTTCSDIGCDSNMKAENAACVCIDGLSPTPTLDTSAVETRYTGCTETAACPLNSASSGDDMCVCDNGYDAEPTFDTTLSRWTHVCQLVACPPGSVFDDDTQLCVCLPGYENDISFDSGTYDECVPAVCDPSALATKGLDCSNSLGVDSIPCIDGYSGSGAWDAAKREWVSSCTQAPCPGFSLRTGDTTCACPWGYSGHVTWSASTGTFEDYCTAVTACPAGTTNTADLTHTNFSTGLSKTLCICPAGHPGSTEFTASDIWEASCDAAPNCPDNAVLSADTGSVACECTKGFKPSSNRGFTVSLVIPDDLSTETLSTTVSYARTGTCDKQECPSNSDDTTFPDCKCLTGYESASANALAGYSEWNAATKTWAAGCQIATCPDNAVNAPNCECDVGYLGTLTFTGGKWSGVCGIPACPAGTESYTSTNGKPKCRCPTGEFGAAKWIPNIGWELTCADQTCPDSTVRIPGSADCACHDGYRGGYEWKEDAGIYVESSSLGACTLVNVPDNTKRVVGTYGVTLTPEVGYTTFGITWSALEGKWNGNATKIECSSVGIGVIDLHPECKCDKGYKGTLTWDPAAMAYAGACTVETCPDNAEGHPDCTCKANFVSSQYATTGVAEPTWNHTTMEWTTTCDAVPCPANATKQASDGACICNPGFKGTVEFANGAYRKSGGASGTICERVACPPGAREIVRSVGGASIRDCECSEGYTGILSWNSLANRWGTCTKKACPAHSTGHPTCYCVSGYTGNVQWTGSDYTSTCSVADALATDPEWRAVSVDGTTGVFGTPVCTTVRGSSSTSTPLGGGIVALEFKDEGEMIRCDVPLNVQFSMLKGSFKVIPEGTSKISNTFQVTAWGSATHSQSVGAYFVAAGTLFNVVDPGMEGGTSSNVYTGSKTIWIPQASVTHTNVLRVEVAQPAGTKMQLEMGSGFEVYGTLASTVAVTRTVTITGAR